MVSLRKCYGLLWAMAILAASCQTPSPTPSPASGSVRLLNLDVLITASATLPAAVPTTTPYPSPLAPPTATPKEGTATRTQATPTLGCQNRAELLANLTLGDYTALKAGQVASKVWRLRNNGSCTWTLGYSLRFQNGEAFGAPSQIPLSGEVPPGGTIDLRLILTAPYQPGTYRGAWLLADESGVLFGLGPNADQPLTVVIVVQPAKQAGDKSPPEPPGGDDGCG